MLKVVVLVSGGGTNLQAIIDGVKGGVIRNTKIVGVIRIAKRMHMRLGGRERITSRQNVSRRKIMNPGMCLMKNLGSRQRVLTGSDRLAGFLVVIPPEMIAAYRNRMINIHPSLIPAFCGKGYYGLKVHEAALARGVKVVGATVHFVDEGTDTGPIILQKAVEVEQDDTPEMLQRRVMEQAEWKILPEAIHLIANGKVHVENGHAFM